MGLYSDLSTEELTAKRAEMRAALEKAVTGGVGAVRGNGRAVEYTRADSRELKNMVREIDREIERRSGRFVSGAAGVRW